MRDFFFFMMFHCFLSLCIFLGLHKRMIIFHSEKLKMSSRHRLELEGLCAGNDIARPTEQSVRCIQSLFILPSFGGMSRIANTIKVCLWRNWCSICDYSYQPLPALFFQEGFSASSHTVLQRNGCSPLVQCEQLLPQWDDSHPKHCAKIGERVWVNRQPSEWRSPLEWCKDVLSNILQWRGKGAGCWLSQCFQLV